MATAVQSARLSEIAGYASEWEVTVDAYEQRVHQWLRSALAQAEPFTRIMASDLVSALADGRFKNQFDTNTSRGILDTGTRAQTEEMVFGIPLSASGAERPFYGYLHTDRNGLIGQNDSVLSFYGKIAVRFVPALKDRTSFVIGDTLEDTDGGILPTIGPSSMSEPSWTSVSSALGDVLDFPDLSAFFRKIDNPFNEIGYIEAQYHGAVTPADIAEIVFLRAEPTQPLRSLLEKSNVSWRVVQ